MEFFHEQVATTLKQGFNAHADVVLESLKESVLLALEKLPGAGTDRALRQAVERSIAVAVDAYQTENTARLKDAQSRVARAHSNALAGYMEELEKLLAVPPAEMPESQLNACEYALRDRAIGELRSAVAGIRSEEKMEGHIHSLVTLMDEYRASRMGARAAA